MRWSKPVRLREYLQCPQEAGVYEIGFFRDGDFNAYYVGQSESNVRVRLRTHYSGIGNEEIATYRLFAVRDNLYYRWVSVRNPVKVEAKLLIANDYPWNKR